MNDNISCCGTCRNSCGSGENLYCYKVSRNVTPYEGCMIYEAKKDKKEQRDMSNEEIMRAFINTARAIVIESGSNHFEVDFITEMDEKYILKVDLIKVDDAAEFEEEEKEKTKYDY